VILTRAFPVIALLAVVPGIVAVPASATGQTPDPVVLRLGGDPGRTAHYRHEKQMSLHLPEELGGAVSTRTLLRLDQTVEQSARDSVVVSSEIREFWFDVEPAPEQLPDLNRLEGMRFRSTATPSGRIYRIEVDGASGPVGKPLRDQVESWLRELGFPALPVGQARPGDRWKDTTRVPLSALLGLQGTAEAVEVRTTTLTSIDETSYGPTALLDVRTEWTSAGEGPSPDVIVRGSSRQSVRFAMESGRFIDSRGTSFIRVDISSGAGAEPLRIDAEGSYETRLLEGDG
jgi:hypothetical protein